MGHQPIGSVAGSIWELAKGWKEQQKNTIPLDETYGLCEVAHGNP
jgi:hypothetical protein